MRAVAKLLRMWSHGGVRALIGALIRRLVYFRWRSIVYVSPARAGETPVDWPTDFRFRCYPGPSTLDEREATAFRAVGAEGLLSDLAPVDHVYAVWCGDALACFGAAMLQSPQRSVLGLPEVSVLLGLWETIPPYRNRGLYRRALVEAARELQVAGLSPVFVEVRQENLASIAAIRAAGFQQWARVDAHVWFGTLVRRSGGWHLLSRRA